MARLGSELLADLQARGLIAQMTAQDELLEHLNSASRTVYCGFDPTADSLHIGHLVPLLMLRRFQQAGHRPVALVGGATGLIGDPSFKAQERQLNTADVVATWVDRLKSQVSRFVDLDNAIVANNLDWIGGMDVLTFLRDIGKYFSVNAMIAKESVKQRIERPDSGISFTEFSYMILQSLDFAELYKRHDCTLQIGGSDQWGNITGGIDLTRRLHHAQVFGITVPLITKSDGTKFGKTESGTVWLDPSKTSPYAFYQFWLSTADADVYRFLRYFTFLSVAEISAIEEADRAAEGRPQAQGILACEMTRLIHGDAGLAAAQRITEALFSGNVDNLSESDFIQLGQDGLPIAMVSRVELVDRSLTQLLVDVEMVASGKQVKDALAREAVYVNGIALGAEQNMRLPEVFAVGNARFDRFYLVKLGKKNYHLLCID